MLAVCLLISNIIFKDFFSYFQLHFQVAEAECLVASTLLTLDPTVLPVSILYGLPLVALRQIDNIFMVYFLFFLIIKFFLVTNSPVLLFSFDNRCMICNNLTPSIFKIHEEYTPVSEIISCCIFSFHQRAQLRHLHVRFDYNFLFFYHFYIFNCSIILYYLQYITACRQIGNINCLGTVRCFNGCYHLTRCI